MVKHAYVRTSIISSRLFLLWSVLLFSPLNLKAVYYFGFDAAQSYQSLFHWLCASYRCTVFIRHSKHNRDIWSFHYWHALLACSWSPRQKYLKNEECRLLTQKTIRPNPEQTETEQQNRICSTRSECSVWFCFRELQTLRLKFVPQTSRLFLPHQHKAAAGTGGHWRPHQGGP